MMAVIEGPPRPWLTPNVTLDRYPEPECERQRLNQTQLVAVYAFATKAVNSNCSLGSFAGIMCIADIVLILTATLPMCAQCT